MKDRYLFWNKKLRRWYCFLFWHIFFLTYSLIEDSYNLIPASALNLLWYVALGEIHKENLASFSYVIKKEEYFNSFFRVLWIFFFDPTLKVNKWKFLKYYLQFGIWNHINELFIFCLFKNPLVSLGIWIDLSLIHNFQT